MTEPGTILITGGSAGLGLACARALAAVPGVTLVLTGRDPERFRAEAASLGARAAALDLGSLASVRRFTEGLAADLDSGALPPLRGLVANAGGQHVRDTRTEDGLEATFAVNHLGHLALIAGLKDRFADPARACRTPTRTPAPRSWPGRRAPTARPPGAAGTPPPSWPTCAPRTRWPGGWPGAGSR
jgi:NAD(P)-dependent dehydrogenase (short-subunit alcohol dehydrogenase family)